MANTLLKKEACGSCSFDVVNPKDVPTKIKVVNVNLKFEDALKLKAAVDECVIRLNRLNRSTSAAKKSRLKLVTYFGKKRIQVIEVK